MARLRNIHTGAVVSVSSETAARLDREWEPIDSPKTPAKKAGVKKSATK